RKTSHCKSKVARVTSKLAQSAEAEVQFARGEILFSRAQSNSALRRETSAGFDMAPFSLPVIGSRFVIDNGLA
ncbi:MAG: hypothetical protein WAU24_06295, partial [Chitinophagaceae bacterium]